LAPTTQLPSIEDGRLDLESRLRAWLVGDISILDPSLLAIGEQVETDVGASSTSSASTRADDLVVAALKRDKTPREVTARALDYASRVVDLSNSG
jgi:hypothetical protein